MANIPVYLFYQRAWEKIVNGSISDALQLMMVRFFIGSSDPLRQEKLRSRLARAIKLTDERLKRSYDSEFNHEGPRPRKPRSERALMDLRPAMVQPENLVVESEIGPLRPKREQPDMTQEMDKLGALLSANGGPRNGIRPKR